VDSFPIVEIYKKVARINLLRDSNKSVIGTGTGFFYWNYNDGIYFVTKRDSIIVEEKGFLPDSVVLYPNIEAKNFGDGNGMSISLYDENEKPTWRMLPGRFNESFVSIPVTKQIPELQFTEFFVATESLPSQVYLPLEKVSLEFQIPMAVSLADYFFYSDSKNEKIIHKHVENQVGFKINRKGFAKDMLEMVLMLINYNMEDIEKSNNSEKYLKIHHGLVLELDKIIRQFSDVLIPPVLQRIKNIFELINQKNFLEDNLVIRFLINRVLQQLGQNIFFIT